MANRGFFKFGPITFVPFYVKDAPFYQLTNFSPNPVAIPNVRVFPTAEHAFHWYKFTNDRDLQKEYTQRVLDVPTTAKQALTEATHLFSRMPMPNRVEWNRRKFGVMKMILQCKFQPRTDLAAMLRSTQTATLVEDTAPATTPEKEWGWGYDGTGENKLGIALMEIRNELFALSGHRHLMVDANQKSKELCLARRAYPASRLPVQAWLPELQGGVAPLPAANSPAPPRGRSPSPTSPSSPQSHPYTDLHRSVSRGRSASPARPQMQRRAAAPARGHYGGSTTARIRPPFHRSVAGYHPKKCPLLWVRLVQRFKTRPHNLITRFNEI